jgi:hypothetical protein
VETKKPKSPREWDTEHAKLLGTTLDISDTLAVKGALRDIKTTLKSDDSVFREGRKKFLYEQAKMYAAQNNMPTAKAVDSLADHELMGNTYVYIGSKMNNYNQSEQLSYLKSGPSVKAEFFVFVKGSLQLMPACPTVWTSLVAILVRLN